MNFYYLALFFLNDQYTIHGLWPQYNKSSYPQYCRKVDFSIQQIIPLLHQLRDSWPSYDEDNVALWEHEWKKHGSCILPPVDERTYFQLALGLYTSTPKSEMHACRGMIPFSLNFSRLPCNTGTQIQASKH